MKFIGGGSQVIASRVSIVIVSGLLIGLVAGAGEVYGLRADQKSVAVANDLRATISPARLQEFSRVPASFHPPSFSAKNYKICRKIVMQSSPEPNGEFPPAARVLFDYVSGTANSAKQGNSATVGTKYPAELLSRGPQQGYNLAPGVVNGIQYNCVYAAGQLNYNGKLQLPPMRVTFLGFGFQPVTATVILEQSEQDQPLTLVQYQNAHRNIQTNGSGFDQAAPITVVATARLRLLIKDVSVNGQSLNVGSSCQTKGTLTTPNNGIDPEALVLAGGRNTDDPQPGMGIGPIYGGSLAGLATIPPFTGCVSPDGENLDPLITATVSGSRNYVQVVAGSPCVADQPTGACTNNYRAASGPNYSVAHGGNYSATSPSPPSSEAFQLVSNLSTNFSIACDSSIASGTFPNAAAPLRGAFASIRFSSMTGCKGSDGNTYDISSESTAFFSGVLPRNEATGQSTSDVVDGEIDRAKFSITGPGGCEDVLSGLAHAQYENTGSVLAINPLGDFNMELFPIPGKSSCPSLATTVPPSFAEGYAVYGITATYVLGPVKPVIRDGLP